MRRRPLLAVVAVAASLAVPAATRAADAAPTKTYFEIPAADGTPLRACAIAEPGALTGSAKHPVILEWTSYAIDGDFGGYFPAGCPPQFGQLADTAARAGYVYVAANTRGTAGSGGDHQDVWDIPDARDGAHVVEWLAGQRWSTGRVGIVGCSNSGAFANGVAAVGAPHLDAVVTDCAPLDPYRDTFYPGGLASYSLLFTSSRPIASQDTAQGVAVDAQRGDASFVPRPVLSSATQADFITHTTDDDVWTQRDLTARAPFHAPTLYLGSWQDYMLRGTTEYARIRKPQDRILITPGEHGAAYLQIDGRYGLVDRAMGWFDHWLRGRPDQFANEPPVQWWQLSNGASPIPTGQSPAVSLPSDGFRGSASWPPHGVGYQRWYLHDGTSGTSSSVVDRTLSTSTPGEAESPDTYLYPGASGATFTDPRQPGGDSNPGQGSDNGAVATYTSAPLSHDLHLAGPVDLSLWATSSAPVTDWVVRLVVVAPDGTATDLTEGWLRSTFRALDGQRTMYDAAGDIVRPFHPCTSSDLTPVATPVHYDVEVEPTGAVVAKGYRLRVVVSSTATPWFLQPNPPAVNQVLHDKAHPSYVLLPTLPG